jgi:hypothetical protein
MLPVRFKAESSSDVESFRKLKLSETQPCFHENRGRIKMLIWTRVIWLDTGNQTMLGLLVAVLLAAVGLSLFYRLSPAAKLRTRLREALSPFEDLESEFRRLLMSA